MFEFQINNGESAKKKKCKKLGDADRSGVA